MTLIYRNDEVGIIAAGKRLPIERKAEQYLDIISLRKCIRMLDMVESVGYNGLVDHSGVSVCAPCDESNRC